MKKAICEERKTKNLKIFTEAGTHIGLGHFTRMSGICEMANRHGIPVKMYLDTQPELYALLNRNFVEFINWREQRGVLKKLTHEDTVVVDSYKIGLPLLSEMNKTCANLVIVDDNIRLPYNNMLVLNPNYYGEILNYPQDKGNRYLLGKNYTLLRQEFYSPFERKIKEKVSEVLITIGGTDVQGLTYKVIEAIKEIDPHVKLHVVATDAFSDMDKIKGRMSPNDILHMNISAQKMRNLMLQVDFTVAAAGGTSNELIKLQCPSALFVVADNQLRNAAFVKEKKLAKMITIECLQDLQELFSYGTRNKMRQELSKLASNKSGSDAILDIVKGKAV